MPTYPMGKMDNCPGPRAQGGPALAEEIIENQRNRGTEKKVKRKKDRREGRKVKKKI